MTELFSNSAQTTINQGGGIGSTDTTVVVTALTGTNPANSFPSSGNFRILFGTGTNNEIALCTSVNTTNNTLTILRGQEGTTPQAWTNGTTVTLVVTSQSFNQGMAEVFQAGPYANRPAIGRPTGSRYQCTDGGVFVWDSGLGAWRPEINGFLGYQPPAAASWTPVNQGTSTLADAAGALIMNGVLESGFQLRMYAISVTAPAFAELCCSYATTTLQGGNQYAHIFVGFRESSSGKVFVTDMTIDDQSNGQSGQIDMQYFSSNTSRTGFVSLNTSNDSNGPMFIRVRRDSNTLYSDFSRDGQYWYNFTTLATSSAFTTVPDQVVIGSTPDSSGTIRTVGRMISFHYGQFLPQVPTEIISRLPPPSPPSPALQMNGWLGPTFNH